MLIWRKEENCQLEKMSEKEFSAMNRHRFNEQKACSRRRREASHVKNYRRHQQERSADKFQPKTNGLVNKQVKSKNACVLQSDNTDPCLRPGIFRNDLDGNNAKDKGHQNSAVREIPGFYYDPEKKRYFKITKDHPSKKFAQCHVEGKQDDPGNRSPGKKSINKPRRMSIVKRLQQREYNHLPFQLTRKDMLEQLCCLLKVKQKLSLSTTMVSRIEPDANHENLLMLCESRLTGQQIVQCHCLSDEEDGNLKLTHHCSMMKDQKVAGLLWSPHISTRDHFIVSHLGHGIKSGDTVLFKRDGFGQHKIGQCAVPGCTVWTNSWSRNPQFSNLISVGTSKGLLLWDINSSHQISMRCGSDVFAQEFSWSRPLLYNGSRDGCIRTCDIRSAVSNWPVMCMRQGKLASVTCIRALRDENYLLSSGLNGSLKLWDLRAKACVQNYRGHVNEITHKLPFYLDPTESLMFAAGQDSVTRIWSIASGELLRSIPFPEIMDKSLNQIPALYYSEAWGVGRGIPGLLYGAENSIYFYSF